MLGEASPLNTLLFVDYTIIAMKYCNYIAFVCVHSSVKQFEKVINNTINFIKAEILCHTTSHLSEHT